MCGRTGRLIYAAFRLILRNDSDHASLASRSLCPKIVGVQTASTLRYSQGIQKVHETAFSLSRPITRFCRNDRVANVRAFSNSQDFSFPKPNRDFVAAGIETALEILFEIRESAANAPLHDGRVGRTYFRKTESRVTRDCLANCQHSRFIAGSFLKRVCQPGKAKNVPFY